MLGLVLLNQSNLNVEGAKSYTSDTRHQRKKSGKNKTHENKI